MSDNDEKTVPFESVAADAPGEATSDRPTTDAAAPFAPTAPTEPYDRPRTRWAAIVWGLIIAGIAATTLAIVGSPERRLAVSDWAATVTPGAFWILSLLVVGVLILVLAVLALTRRAQGGRRAA